MSSPETVTSQLSSYDIARLAAIQQIYRVETAMVATGIKELTHDVEAFTRTPTLSSLARVEGTCETLRRRMTRQEILEDIL